jgi:hypothetical protein
MELQHRNVNRSIYPSADPYVDLARILGVGGSGENGVDTYAALCTASSIKRFDRKGAA